jgi:hypothetical protein
MELDTTHTYEHILKERFRSFITNHWIFWGWICGVRLDVWRRVGREVTYVDLLDLTFLWQMDRFFP